MASVLKVDKLDPQSGTALEIGTSGDTVTVPTGAGLTVTDEVKTNKVSPATGTAFALGDSGDTFTVPSGATFDISAATLTPPATMPASSGINFTALNATNLGSGTVPTARLGSGTASSSVFLAGDNTWASPGGIDCGADAWARIAPMTDQASAAVLDWETSVHLGSNITESGGVITVGTAGWYLVGIHISNASNQARIMDMLFRKNDTAILGKTYWDNCTIKYMGMQSTVIVECDADDTLDVYGSGYYAGDTVASTSVTWFTGVRLGA